jgi:hypothetical protein
MKQTLFPVAAVGLCLAGAVRMAAQMPDESPIPKVLMITREQIKEGHEAAHIKTEEAWPRIFQKGNVKTHYLGMTSESGPSEAWFLEPYDSFAGMQKERAEIQQSPLAADLEVANVLDGDLRTGSSTLLSVFRGDLSYRPADAMSAMPKCRFMEVTVLHIKYGHDAELAQGAKLLIDGYDKSASGQPVLAYQVVSGSPSGTYLLLAPMESLARMDAAPARMDAARQAMGERNRQHFDSLAPEVVQSSEDLLFSFNPRISYLPKEFTDQDPGFWIPKPAEPPKHKR